MSKGKLILLIILLFVIAMVTLLGTVVLNNTDQRTETMQKLGN